MYLMSLVIACLLFTQDPLNTNSAGQQAAPTESPAPLQESTSGDGLETASKGANAPERIQVVPVRPDSRQATPEELVDRAISSTATDEIPGEPLSLLAALSNVRGQAERIDVVHAYWRSTLALAKYGVALDENRQLTELNAGTALARSASRVETSRLAAIEAQRRLAQTSRLPRSTQLPMPSDRPHVRAYKTRFEEIFSTSVPTERVRLIDRKLPLRLQVVNVRASAVEAAEDALAALTDSYRAKEADLASVTATVGELARQRRAYLEAVCDYNHEIANYALSIVGQEITGRQLVATLIDVERNAPVVEPRQGGANETRRQSDVQRAEFVAPLDTDKEGFWEPTPAVEGPPRIISPPAAGDEKPPAIPLPTRETASDREATGGWAPVREMARPPKGALEYGQAGGSQSPMTSLDNSSTAKSRSSARLPLVPVERTVFRLPLDDGSAAAIEPSARYSDLLDAEPAIQAGRLVTDLLPNLEETFDDCQPVDLRDCLADRSVEDCQGVINAYWLTRLRACEYQVSASRVEHLRELVPIALGRTSEPLGSEDMLRLHATRLSSDADVLEAHARLLDAQYELTLAVERPLDSPWLLPRISPRCGRYPLKLDAQPRSLAESWPIRRLAVTIPTLSEAVMSRASAVVEADAARSNAVGQFADGTLSVDTAMGKIQKQSEHTLAFLDTVTAYNQSIAEYVVRTNLGTAADVTERVLKPVDSQ
jgi:hypothetical protein